MFHQVRVTEQDTDSLRFFWKEDMSSEGPPETYKMLVHIFGAKDSPTCANYAVQRTARDNQHDFDAETALKAFYVDDLLKAVHSEECAISLAEQRREMMKQGGFRLCKFSSNRRSVLQALPQSEVSPAAMLAIDAEESLERALGVFWDTLRDVFTFVINFKSAPATKRGILKTTSSLFDPAGFLTLFILIAKILLQMLWRLGFDWDDDIEDSLQKHREKWLANAKKLETIKINRQFVLPRESPIISVELYVFCDASEKAFGAVAYARISFKDGVHKRSLVMSKSRLAPIKTVTLPHLELCATRCGARLVRLVVRESDLPIQKVWYWSDLTLAIQYLCNRRQRMKTFVANCVSEVLESSNPEDWRHLIGDLNPADLLTRGVIDPEKLLRSRWFPGPTFLETDEDKWPKSTVGELDPKDIEVKKKPLFTMMTSMVDINAIDFTRISSWLRMKRVAAWVLRFAENVRVDKEDRQKDELDADELKSGEHLVLKDVQKVSFEQELNILQVDKALPSSNRLSSLCPFVDSTGLVRVGGRLSKMPVPWETKHPIVLPRTHHVTKMLVEGIHRGKGHIGPEHTLSIVRESTCQSSSATMLLLLCATSEAEISFHG